MPALNDPKTYSLDFQTLDDDHAEFISLINAMADADNTEFAILFAQLFTHTEQHFERENTLMDQYSFPATAEHKGEHQRVLGDFKQFKKRVDKGLIPFGRAYVNDTLPKWFELHVQTMDSALVTHIKNNNVLN